MDLIWGGLDLDSLRVGSEWIELVSIALDRNGLDWAGLEWFGFGADWTRIGFGLDWSGSDRVELDWVGLDWVWIGLDLDRLQVGLGLDWLRFGSDWIELQQIGLKSSVSRAPQVPFGLSLGSKHAHWSLLSPRCQTR